MLFGALRPHRRFFNFVARFTVQGESPQDERRSNSSCARRTTARAAGALAPGGWAKGDGHDKGLGLVMDEARSGNRCCTNTE